VTRVATIALVIVAACAGDHRRPPPVPSQPPSATVGPSIEDLSAKPTGEGMITGWLTVEGNRIRLPDGKPFHGRGANVHDTRGCDACAWERPHVDEVTRRIDVLVDEWHATFLRLLLESYPDDGSARNGGKGRTHWRSVLDDEDYFRDAMRIIGHVGKKRGVYVLVSLWQDPSFDKLGWPTEGTRAVWRKLAEALKDIPFVLFGLVNEPQHNEDGRLDARVWKEMNDTVAAIRSVERGEHPHVVTVQGTREWGRSLDYYLEHPITAGGGRNVAYETHVYDRPARFEELVARPAKKLPVVIGEMGARVDEDVTMFPEDCVKLMDLAEKLEVPWLAWTFHNDCPPNLLVDRKGVCAGAPLDPSPWGRIVKDRLARPW
jgi:endoglucanase